MQTAERMTREGFSDRPEWTPGWSPGHVRGGAEGRRTRSGGSRLTAAGPPSWSTRAPDAIREGVFTPDGNSVVYRMDTPDSNRDIYLLPLAGERKPVPS